MVALTPRNGGFGVGGKAFFDTSHPSGTPLERGVWLGGIGKIGEIIGV